MSYINESPVVEKRAAASTLSKKRFELIMKLVDDIVTDPKQVDVFKSRFCEIMAFDPNASAYTQERNVKTIEWRKKKAQQLGTSTYVTSGRKRNYEKEKERRKETIDLNRPTE